MRMPDHKTKIVCTIGPASESPEMLRQLVEAGMDVARLNFSHGEFASHRRVVDHLRAAAAAADRGLDRDAAARRHGAGVVQGRRPQRPHPAVLVPTRSGATARNIARFRFPVWTVAVSPLEATCRHLQLSAGVFPVHEADFPERWNGYAKRLVGDLGLAGDLVILTEGPSPKHPAANHRMEIIDLTRADNLAGSNLGA